MKLESCQICKFYTKELQVKISFCMGQLGDIFGQPQLSLCKTKTTQHVSCILISPQH